MNEPRVVLSARAGADLNEIENFITAVDGSARAVQVIARISSTLRTLAFMPGIGRKRHESSGRNALFFATPPWLIAYAPRRDLKGIRVIRIVDGRRDLKNIFRSSSSSP